MTGWKDVVRGVAPALGAALGGPGVGGAIAVLSKALLGKPDGAASEIEARLASPLTPADEMALRKADQEFLLAVLDKANAAEATEAADRANARDMHMATRSVTPAVLSYLGVGLFALDVAASHFYSVPASNKELVSGVQSVLTLILGTIYGFWLGGSFGSRMKDVMNYARGGRA